MSPKKNPVKEHHEDTKVPLDEEAMPVKQEDKTTAH